MRYGHRSLQKKCLPLHRSKEQNDCFTDFKKAKKMKKLVFMFVAIAAISFASCGNKTAQAEGADTTDTAAVDTVSAVDTAAVDTAAADTAK